MAAKTKYDELLKTLQQRFKSNMNRHPDLAWNNIQEKLTKNPEKAESLFQMEESGGEPDVVGLDPKSGAYLFYDCSPESPKGRRSFCYDREALDKRKENKPKTTQFRRQNQWVSSC